MELTSLNKDRKRKKPTLSDEMIISKVPPNDRELEKALLGVLLLSGNRMVEVIEPLLKPKHFYVEIHQELYASILRVFHSHLNVEFFTVTIDLQEHGKLDENLNPAYITQVSNRVLGNENVERYAVKIIDSWKKRELIKLSMKSSSDAYEDTFTADEILDDLNKGVDQITSDLQVISGVEMVDNLLNFVSVIDDRINKAKNGQIQGITSGYPEIDEATNGWQRTDLITIAAMSSTGKTAYSLNLARNAAKSGIPVAFFSREMSKQQLMERLISMESRVALETIKNGKMDDDVYKRVIAHGVKGLETLPLYIIPASGMTWMDIRRQARQLKRKYGVQMIVDDYIQIGRDIDTKGKNREQIIATISGENKITAQELDIAFIQLSQVLGKEIAKRDNKQPQMQDVRESEAIVNDSNIVMMLYRPEYHNIFHAEDGGSMAGKTFIKFVKFRDGVLGKQVELRSNLSIQRFFSSEDHSINEVYTGKGQGFIPFSGDKESKEEYTF